MTTDQKHSPKQTILFLTQGDPASIAPEITIKAWKNLRQSGPAFIWIGDPALLTPHIPVHILCNIDEVLEGEASFLSLFPLFRQALPVLSLSLAVPARPGCPDPKNAARIAQSIRIATELTLDLTLKGHSCAMVTNPISKDIMHIAGFQHPGHTTYLAELCQVPGQEVMMLVNPFLRVVPLTGHVSLRTALTQLTPELISSKARIVARGLVRDFGLPYTPRLAIAGLNPHAGENGLMGQEEQTILTPAITLLRSEGFTVSDPLPADTLFTENARSLYDVALCMYHDQALIPLKTLDMAHGVNVTLGLPIIRTSPDHGTAFSIAGQGKADSRSLESAIRLTAQMSLQRQKAS